MPPRFANESELQDWMTRAGNRFASRAANGRQPSKRERDREAQHDAARAEIVDRFEVEQARPMTERVPEYVIRYDDAGNPVGLERA